MIVFEAGDIVRLKKDYQQMCVCWIEKEWIVVSWFDELDNFHRRRYRPEDLVLVERN